MSYISHNSLPLKQWEGEHKWQCLACGSYTKVMVGTRLEQIPDSIVICKSCLLELVDIIDLAWLNPHLDERQLHS